ncbi:MAG: hypothetical protein CMJ85_14535 [Planctomycetes bacterium]|jgi:hypothetical protein|nr:hypothetical protein [Planctomycetota bacterium]MDP6425115.1 hypothetical protein [Planctomycetota bacterium]
MKPEPVCSLAAFATVIAISGLSGVSCSEKAMAEPLHRRTIPAGQSKIRTIRAVELKSLPGKVGQWARERELLHEQDRRKQGWLQPVDKDFGEQPVNTKLVGKFELRNPTDRDQRITNIMSSCACQGIVVWIGDKEHVIPKGGLPKPILVPKGATGRLEARILVPDRQGRIYTEVRVDTSDPDVSSIRLSLSTIGVREFIVEHDGQARTSLDLGLLSIRSTREFEFTVKSRDKKPFVVERWNGAPDAFKIEAKKASHLEAAEGRPDGSVWKVRGKVGPGLTERSVGGLIHFDTDRKDTFEINVYMLVKPSISASPSFLSYGIVPKGKGGTRDIHLAAVDPADRFEVTGVDFLDLRPKTTVTAECVSQDGRSASIRVTIPADVPKGRLSGKVRVRFASDKLPPKVVAFLAIVR